VRLPWRRGERASSLDLLVVGLGNPGASTRETGTTSAGWSSTSSRGGTAARGGEVHGSSPRSLDGHRVALLKPETYMNESGRSVVGGGSSSSSSRTRARRPRRGRLRPRPAAGAQGGGLAGHNGLRSIAQHLGTQDFLRLRIGVGRPERGDRRSLADYVLSELRAARRRRGDRRAGRRGDRDARRRGPRRTQARFN
jgi:PTH1 family peptidyl-tRNA hydrolase